MIFIPTQPEEINDFEHGGQLKKASDRWNIPADQWLDLSTGINPYSWPVPPIPESCFQRLPEVSFDFRKSVQRYYGVSKGLAADGSQAFIQLLPQAWSILKQSTANIGLFSPGYFEHQKAWQAEGHHIIRLHEGDVEALLDTLDVLLIINPNNPSTKKWSTAQLMAWHSKLAAKGGWLIVDEAFIDVTPNDSLCPELNKLNTAGLIVLRSIGKFFGLAGIRAGFMFGDVDVMDCLSQKLGPWPVSHPTLWIVEKALSDFSWQRQTRFRLLKQSVRLAYSLEQANFSFVEQIDKTPLFVTLRCRHKEDALTLYDQFCYEGILVRLFYQHALVRIGLPGYEESWSRLSSVLTKMAKRL